MGNILQNNAAEILLEDYNVGKIIGRKNQKDNLETSVFNQIKEGQKGTSTTYIYGSSGTGKTHTIKNLQQQAKNELDYLGSNYSIQYINGRRTSTYYSCLIQIADNLSEYLPIEANGKVRENIPPSGLPSQEILNIITNIIEEEDVLTLVTIDEIDKLEKEAINKLITLFHDLRSGNKEGCGRLPVHLISISNDPRLLENFYEDFDRRVSEEHHFPKYDAPQLLEILEEFAELTLKPNTYEKGGLAKIAREAHETSGSASEAKKLLYHTAKNSEEMLNSDNIGEAQKEVEQQMMVREIKSKPAQHQAALKAVAETWQEYQYSQSNNLSKDQLLKYAPTIKNIHGKYQDVCENADIRVKSKKQMGRYVKQLKEDNMVSSGLEGFGRGQGVAKIVEPLYDNELLIQILENSLSQRDPFQEAETVGV